VRRYSRDMPSAVLVPPTTAPFAFDLLECQPLGAGQAPQRWRLAGRAADGRHLLLDVGGAVPAAMPSRLTRARVAPVAPPVAGEAGRSWAIHADQGRFDLGTVRLFVHEDVSAQAAVAVPPRPVPLAKRLFWRAVFALLATRAGRRWLERRVAGV
jgi:hypothetical protein